MDHLESIRDARSLLHRARDAVQQVHQRVPALTSAMRWRARSAEEFAAALGEWVALLHRIDDEIERWDAVLRRREEAAAAAAPHGGRQR